MSSLIPVEALTNRKPANAGDLNGSAAIGRKNVRLMEKLAFAQPSSVPVRNALASAYTILGDVMGNNEQPNLGDANGAMDLFQKAQSIIN
jgi:hypothetical protein